MRRPSAAVGSAVFFLVAPGTVVGLIPWLLTGWQLRQLVPPYWAPMRMLGAILLGAILLVAGLIVLVQAFVRFVVEGLGTPAPIAAPERLVVGGLYRYVRNPMYVAVLAAPPASLETQRARRTRRTVTRLPTTLVIAYKSCQERRASVM